MPQIRNHSLDLMRVLAAFGIVWAHMQAPFMEVGYLALGLFVTLTTVMAVGSAQTRSLGRFMRGRFWRIFLPWLVWCGFYLLVEMARSGDITRLWQLTDWQSLLVGPYVHLWFLPFVILSAPLAFVSTRVFTDAGAIWTAVLPMGAIGAGALALHDHYTLAAPWAQWASVTVPFFYGILSAAAKRYGPVLAPLVFVVFATAIPIIFWQSQAAVFLLGAALLFELFWRIHLRADWLPGLGALSFGVYLVHPVVLLVWYKLTLDQLPRSIGAVAVFAGSLVFAAGIQWGWAKILPRRSAGPLSTLPDIPVESPCEDILGDVESVRLSNV